MLARCFVARLARPLAAARPMLRPASRACMPARQLSAPAAPKSTGAWGRGVAAKGTAGAVTAVALLAGVGVALAEEKRPQDKDSSFADKVAGAASAVTSPFVYASSSLNELVAGDKGLLLPDLKPDIYGRNPRTVVVGLEKTLTYSTWNRTEGWRVRKRPHVDAFLEKLARAGFEVVLWSSKQQMDVEELVMRLDRMGALKHKLYAGSMNFKGQAGLVKDLTRLNRDMAKVVIIDAESNAIPTENAIHITPFTEDFNDTELLRLASLLENCARYNTYDMRKIVADYNKDPTANHFAADEALARESRISLGLEDEHSKEKGGEKKKKKGWFL